MTSSGLQPELFENANAALEQALDYPKFRYMGSKHKLLPWIYNNLSDLKFDTVLDGFSGSGAVSYLFKAMGKKVISNDFLNFPAIITKATCENSDTTLDKKDVDHILKNNPGKDNFIKQTFEGIFFTKEDLEFLDLAYWNISKLNNEYKKALALTCLFRSCLKKQPRGVFTVSGDLSNYNDGRRDLKISLKTHFLEQIKIFNSLVFSNGKNHFSVSGDIFEININEKIDLVYFDPPYVPNSDDNCYTKRYHFLEGLSKYWKDEEILYDTKVKKIKKKYTPFSYRSQAIEAFDNLFYKFKNSIIVLSYSDNGFPDLEIIQEILSKYKSEINVIKKPHRYHFGNHAAVKRSEVEEYLIIGK